MYVFVDKISIFDREITHLLLKFNIGNQYIYIHNAASMLNETGLQYIK